MVVVAWVSKHKPLPVQIVELKRKLGNDLRIVILDKTFRDVKDVYEDIKACGAEYAVLVLPLSMISALVQRDSDITWLWAKMDLIHENCKGVRCPEFNLETDTILEAQNVVRHLRFAGFRKIVKVEMITERW